MIKVSVIVPVYNVEDYLAKCLDSLVHQTLKDIEIIVVNDGSPDNSQKIIDKYQKKYPTKIKSFSKPNGGLSSARNYGLKYAKGKYISFVDSDDWLTKDALEKMYNKAVENDSDIVICDMANAYNNGTLINLNCTKYNSIYKVTPSVCNKLFNKNIIANIKFLEGIWYEDLNFTTKLLLKKPKITTISEPLYNCNVHFGSITNNNESLKNLDIIIVIDDLIKYSKENNCYDNDIISFLIFQHILIDAINRVNFQKNKNKMEVLKKLQTYCKTNLKNYENLPFYKEINKNRKIIAKLNYLGLFIIAKLLLNIKAKLK